AKIQYELASVYYRLNRLEDAQSAIEKTIDIIEKQRVSISQFDSRASYFASVHRYYTLYVQILMSLERRRANQGFAEKAFDAAERSKVRSLLDLLTTSAQDAPCEELLQKQLRAGETNDAEPSDVKLVAMQTSAPGTNQEPQLSSSTLTAKEAQAEIGDDDTVLLEYALGDEQSYLWAIDRQHTASYALPPSGHIKKVVESFRKTLQPPQSKEGESAAEYQ